MVDAISISLSALKVNAQKIGVAATNIAHAGTGASYTPQDVVSITGDQGEVSAQIVDRAPGGDVDLATEMIHMKQAEIAYKASAKVIKTAEKMQDELIKTFDQKV